jgi:SAM-dependent methyltransferase/uncharacterized protein YbaR (Trm112 family)
MKRTHFERFQPICPLCNARETGERPLRISCVAKEEQHDIVEGVLQCDDPTCLREYPIIDGLPLLVADVPSYIQQHLLAIYGREDFTELAEAVLSDCCGPSSAYDIMRQHLSSYVWDHYADLAPSSMQLWNHQDDESGIHPMPGGVVRALEDARYAAQPLTPGPTLDVGCSVGRTTFELAENLDDLVLGVDLNYSMLRWARRVLTTARVKFPCREVGVIYRNCEFPVQFRRNSRVDFWACDAMAMPFRSGTFNNVVAMNILDCLPCPLDFLKGVGSLLPAGGKALLTTPFDWSASATPMSAWLGGHSGRRVDQGQSESVMKRLFQAADTQDYLGLRLINSGEAPPWHVRLHARSTMLYRNHRVILQSTKSYASEIDESHVEPPHHIGAAATIAPLDTNDTTSTAESVAVGCAINAKVH